MLGYFLPLALILPIDRYLIKLLMFIIRGLSLRSPHGGLP